jgi:ribose/xylose/arabinose/galactoside ABC-type transport system permease subunit
MTPEAGGAPESVETSARTEKPQEPKSRGRIAGLPVETGVTVVLLSATLWLSMHFPQFRELNNLSVILSATAEIAILAAGMTLVIATGGIDISVGSILGFAGVVLGLTTVNRGWPLWQGVAAALAAGAGCGLVNGLLIARFRVPPIIATLAMFSAARAGAYVLSKGDSISGLPEKLTDTVGYGSWPPVALANGTKWSGIPYAAWIAIATLIIMGLLLKKTAFGRGLLAMGGNREAAYLSGLRVRNIELLVYTVSGLLAGLAAIVATARGATAVPDAGKFFELRAITAVVIGGTPVVGGRATMTGAALGVLLIGVVGNGVVSYGKDAMYEMLVMAIVLLVSVEVDRLRRVHAKLA